MNRPFTAVLGLDRPESGKVAISWSNKLETEFLIVSHQLPPRLKEALRPAAVDGAWVFFTILPATVCHQINQAAAPSNLLIE
jgi:hypothetical protein